MAQSKFNVTVPETKVDDFISYASEKGIQIVTSVSKEAFLFNEATVKMFCIVEDTKQAEIAAGPWKDYLNK